MEFTQWLQSNGYDAAALSEVQRKHLMSAWKAETTPPPQVAAPVKEVPKPTDGERNLESVLEAQRQENNRCQRITELVAQYTDGRPALLEAAGDIGKIAIASKWNADKVDLELLRLSRNVGGNIHINSPRREQITADVIEAAVCQAGRLENLETQFNPRVLEAAQKEFKHGIGLVELVLHFARANGCRDLSIRNTGTVLRSAFRTPDDGFDLRADGPSTYTLPGILSNVANKFLRTGFDAVESVWRQVAAIRAVRDFKQISSYALTGDLTYELVPPSGEIRQGTIGDITYNNQASTYGKLLGIDRRDLINDDLGALTSAGRRLGRGGALKLNDVFWTDFLNDSTFFPTNKSKLNYDDGATDSVLSLAGLDNANTIFGQQTDPDGKPLGLRPRILLVPINLWATAKNLMANASTASAQNTATVTIENVWSGMFDIASTVYLSSSAITGNSATAWYLLADPNDLPVTEICFLNGVEMPTVETADMEIERLGIAMRGFHDFGVAKQEYRAGVKLKGAA